MADVNALFGIKPETKKEQEVVVPTQVEQVSTTVVDIFSPENMRKAYDEGNSFNELGDGEYKVKIDKAVIKLSKTGNPMLAVTYKVIDGDHENRLIFSNTSFVANGELSARGLAEFGNFIKTLAGATDEVAKENAIKAISAFNDGGKEELKLTPFVGKHGKIVISSYEYKKKDANGNATDVVVSGTNKTLKAL